jgi:ABC-type sugar transport system permease subunit
MALVQSLARPRARAWPAVWREAKKHWVPYVYISPFYILFTIFGAFPILFSFYLSFQQWRGNGPMVYEGLGNYVHLIHDPLFWISLRNTVVIWVAAHVPMLLLALVLAFILNSRLVRFSQVFQTLYFTPMVTSSVAVAFVFMTMYGVRFGLINFALKSIGLPPIDWWGGTGFWIKPAIIILFIWRWTGWNMVIYLAGLQGIDPELYDAAKIDGAGLAQIFRYITLPLLKPVILFSLILSFVGGITIFDEPYLLTWMQTLGGTNHAGLTLSLYVYNEGFARGHLGYASAIAYVVCAIILVLSIANLKLFGNPPGAR